MRFNLISNLSNEVGLQQDYLLLKAALEKRGHKVHGVQFNAKPLIAPPADVNIFLEVVTPEVFKAAPVQWAIPNPEWWFSKWDNYPWDLVLTKTRDAKRIFTEKFGSKCEFLGWTARDLYQPTIKRERRFLHISGKSSFKNSAAVVLGGKLAFVSITMIGDHPQRVWQRISEQELRWVMNSHFCHVMPSMYEGYGHILHEAQAVGQVLITTDAPPMNEVQPAILVPSSKSRPHHAGLLHTVEGKQVATAIREALSLTDHMVDLYRDEGRANFHAAHAQFNVALDGLVGK